MNKFTWITGSSLLGVILLFGFTNIALHADSLFENEREEHDDDDRKRSRSPIKPNKLYIEECGACHIAYPSTLLPKASWRKVMQGLDNHFDENAELDKDTTQKIKTYLERNALDSGNIGKLRKMLRNLPKNAPIRITKLPYFIRKHDEIPAKMVRNNPKVGSFSLCDKCHQGAERGDFEEHRVRIPGYGRWED